VFTVQGGTYQMSRNRATKAEAKVLEKLARSAAAHHLYEGLVWKRNYAAHEASSYWRTYKNEPWEMAKVSIFGDTDLAQLEDLLINHDENIIRLEDRLLTELAEHPGCDICDDKTRSYCSCVCHKEGRFRW
jgi:hypothetical protein